MQGQQLFQKKISIIQGHQNKQKNIFSESKYAGVPQMNHATIGKKEEVRQSVITSAANQKHFIIRKQSGIQKKDQINIEKQSPQKISNVDLRKNNITRSNQITLRKTNQRFAESQENQQYLPQYQTPQITKKQEQCTINIKKNNAQSEEQIDINIKINRNNPVSHENLGNEEHKQTRTHDLREQQQQYLSQLSQNNKQPIQNNVQAMSPHLLNEGDANLWDCRTQLLKKCPATGNGIITDYNKFKMQRNQQQQRQTQAVQTREHLNKVQQQEPEKQDHHQQQSIYQYQQENDKEQQIQQRQQLRISNNRIKNTSDLFQVSDNSRSQSGDQQSERSFEDEDEKQENDDQQEINSPARIQNGVAIRLFITRMAERLNDLRNLANNLSEIHRLILNIRILEAMMPAGLNERQINQLPLIQLKKKEASDLACTVCMEDLQEGEQVKVLTCLHKFHPKCIDLWLQKKSCCPNCKSDQKAYFRQEIQQ